MPQYICKYCKFDTMFKANYENHLLTKKHLKESTKSQEKVNILLNESTKSQQKTINCVYCNKLFKHKQSMYYHIKYSCTKNKDEDLKELVRLMNLKFETQAKQIEKLMCKLEINGNVNIQNNTINNIQLLAYKDTDLSHLTDKDYISCIKQVNHCVKKMIEKIHFNPNKPENMNIYISNMKDKYLMVYDGLAWTLSTKEYELEKIYQEKEILMEEWIENNDYPEIKEKFVRYINNKEKDDNLNAIKEDIKLMMYNKKKELLIEK